MKKILFFDCDQTIWTSSNNDYISSIVSPLVPVSKDVILRTADGNIFNLKPEIRKIFKNIRSKGNIIGIVSDNKKDMVINALKLFDVYKLIKKEAVYIKLWKGHCPKEEMIKKITSKPEFEGIIPSNVYWFDDKDYSEEAGLIGVNFIQVDGVTDMEKIVKGLVA